MEREVLKCPSCNSADQLGTVEHLEAIASCEAITNLGPEYDGDTEVIYDTSKTVGVSCKCGFEYIGDDWLDKLNI